MSKGRVAEFGPTEMVYHNPGSLESARVFSDPPLNEAPVTKIGDEVAFGAFQPAPANGVLESLADGAYILAFRPDIVRLAAPWPQSISLDGRIAVAEISGSESFVHVETAIGTMVCVEPGVSRAQPGDSLTLHIYADRIFVFDPSGQRVARTAVKAGA